MANRLLRLTCFAGVSIALLTGCISYTVGMGAETTPVGERTVTNSVNVVPGTINTESGTAPTRRPSVDTDIRFGIDNRTDIGFRVATYSGVMLTWKRQLGKIDSSSVPENRRHSALMLGGGLINLGEHASFEATLITSGKWTAAGQWYGAARVIQVLPLSPEAPHDDPVVGFSIGHLFGDRSSSIGPEIGVYYDRSTLGLNTNRIIVVPAVVYRRGGLPGFGWRR
jgi:hypothetical protein